MGASLAVSPLPKTIMPSESAIQEVSALGFPEDRVLVALSSTEDGVEAAVQFIIDNSEQDDSWWEAKLSQLQPESSAAPGKKEKTIWAGIAQLEDNERQVFVSCCKTMVRILSNILK